MNREEQHAKKREKIASYIRLYVEEGLNYSDIARVSGVTRNYVSLCMKEARKYPDLKQKLEEYEEEQVFLEQFQPLIERQHQSYISNLKIYLKALPYYRFMVENQATYQQTADHFSCYVSSVQNRVQKISSISPTAKEQLELLAYHNLRDSRTTFSSDGNNRISFMERRMRHIDFILKYECGLQGARLCLGCSPSQISHDIQMSLLSDDLEVAEKARKAKEITSRFQNGQHRSFEQENMVYQKMKCHD